MVVAVPVIDADYWMAMAVVEVHPEPIGGPCVEGFVLHQQVISGRPVGHVAEHRQFETTRSSLGELVYQLKFGNDH